MPFQSSFQDYPLETSWKITDSANNAIYNIAPEKYTTEGETYTEQICLANGQYKFEIFDSYDDGISVA